MTQFQLDVPGYSSLVSVFPVSSAPSLPAAAAGRETLVICDGNTEAPARELIRSLEFEVTGTLSLPPGEEQKSLENVEMILDRALELGVSRNGLFVVLGGGVLCDLAAFAASIYLRGVHLQLIPTTLLSMVDAAVGGKTGTNFRGYKNMVGTFYPAEEVRIFPRFLATLPEPEYRSGLAEVIKAALLGDRELLLLLEEKVEAVRNREPEVLEELIARAVKVKIEVVREDLTETGTRAILNLGHTYAHALESVSDFEVFTHGQAVAWGIGRAMVLGELLGMTDADYARRVWRLLSLYGYSLDPVEYAEEDLIAAMAQDKKRKGSQIRFILQRNLGQTELLPVDLDLVRRSLVAGREVGI